MTAIAKMMPAAGMLRTIPLVISQKTKAFSFRTFEYPTSIRSSALLAVSKRCFSSESNLDSDLTTCPCGAALPKKEELANTIEKRIRELPNEVECKYLHSYVKFTQDGCKLRKKIHSMMPELLPRRKNVVSFDLDSTITDLSPLRKMIPLDKFIERNMPTLMEYYYSRSKDRFGDVLKDYMELCKDNYEEYMLDFDCFYQK